MAAQITLPLPEEWQSFSETLNDNGRILAHVEYYLSNDDSESDKALIDVYAGTMPEGSDAGKEALNSYYDIIGDEDETDEDPLTRWPFQGMDAFGFEAICEDDSIMRVMCIEPEPGKIVLMNIVAEDDPTFDECILHVEKNLSIKF